ncbi:putative nad dependent epimerase [Diaporthe ampelina]|uniref:Putative nad dependent epimerase n=1 Tax=Diaporthe ampelina TaxID=1214573 RepID=A0A0G2FTS8_9PEZI|nr:putative nad dependent epimerase [Diaporthe ampelina]
MVRFVHETVSAQELDRSHTHPEVLALGLPRCATSSLQAALETLGFVPCMHMAHVQPSAERQRLATAAALEKDTPKRRKILGQLFAGFAATADFPSIVFADDLMDMYPDAPIVLNVRSGGAASWHTSFSEGLRFFDSWLFWVATFLVRSDRAMMRMMKATDDLYMERWGMTFRDRSIYDKHNDWVKDEARKRDREVLEFQAEHGWEPICQLLGKKMPSTTYPRINDQKTMKMVKRFIICRGLFHWAALFIILWVMMQVGVMLPQSVVSFAKAQAVWPVEDTQA